MKRATLMLAAVTTAFASIVTPARAGVLYVANLSGTIEKYDSVTKADLGTFASGLNSPVGLAFDTSGNLYVSSFNGNTITKITPGGSQSVFVSPSAGLNHPYYLAFDSAGDLYTANAGINTIQKTTPADVTSIFATITGASGSDGLAFNSAGDLFVTAGPLALSNGGSFIEEYSPTGTDLGPFASGLNHAQGLAFDSSGNLYVASTGTHQVLKFTPGGSESVFASFGNGASGLAFDSSGNLWVSIGNSHPNILEFSPAGTEIGTIDAAEPFGLAFEPTIATPEPATFTLLGIGIAGIAGYGWRRRKLAAA